MIEYLYDVIRAVSGQPIKVSAYITEEDGKTPITKDCCLFLYTDTEELYSVEGTYLEETNLWQFEVPAEATAGMLGRYWYYIQHNGTSLCFKKPIYLK